MRRDHPAGSRLPGDPPPGAVPHSMTRTLMALIRVYKMHGRATIREVALAAGVAVSTAHTDLRRLRGFHLAAWDDETAGTLRPLVARVLTP